MTSQIVLELRRRLSTKIIPNAHLRAYSSTTDLLDSTIIELTHNLLAMKKETLVTEHFTYPSDWWQALKKRLGWKHKTTSVPVRTEVYHLCPHLPIPDGAREVHFQYLTKKAEAL